MGDGVSGKVLYPSTGRKVSPCLSLKDGWKVILSVPVLINRSTRTTKLFFLFKVTDCAVTKRKTSGVNLCILHPHLPTGYRSQQGEWIIQILCCWLQKRVIINIADRQMLQQCVYEQVSLYNTKPLQRAAANIRDKRFAKGNVSYHWIKQCMKFCLLTWQQCTCKKQELVQQFHQTD